MACFEETLNDIQLKQHRSFLQTVLQSLDLLRTLKCGHGSISGPCFDPKVPCFLQHLRNQSREIQVDQVGTGMEWSSCSYCAYMLLITFIAYLCRHYNHVVLSSQVGAVINIQSTTSGEES